MTIRSNKNGVFDLPEPGLELLATSGLDEDKLNGLAMSLVDVTAADKTPVFMYNLDEEHVFMLNKDGLYSEDTLIMLDEWADVEGEPRLSIDESAYLLGAMGVFLQDDERVFDEHGEPLYGGAE